MVSESDQSSTPVSVKQATDDSGHSFRAIEFTGTTKEYFGIWISNLVLTFVTLGIYSAWAKVRRIQFFRNHTVIADFPLSYHATGLQLFIGRIIALVIIVTYSVVSTVEPIAAIFIAIAFVFIYSWLANRSLRFNARMTSWRNIRFNWHGTYWKTFWYFTILPLIGLLSLGILFPLTTRYYYRYYAQNHSFGTTRFDAEPTTSSFYIAFLISIVASAIIVLIIAVLVGAIIFLAMSLFGVADHEYLDQDVLYPDAGGMSVWQALFFILLIFPLVLFSLFRTMSRNILLRSLILDDAVTFDSSLGPVRYLWIRVSNLLAIVVSLGLMIPWASVREYRYLAQCTAYRFEIDDAEFVDDEQERMSAFGEEFAGLEDVDISI